MKLCKHCNEPLKNSNSRFCNNSCAAKFNNQRRAPRTIESRIKTAKAVCQSLGTIYTPKPKSKANPLISATKQNIPYTKVQQCTICKKYFDYDKRCSTTCSDSCFIHVKTKLNNTGKKCVYNGKSFDSIWEKDIAIFMDNHAISWIQPKSALEWIDTKGKKRKYFPDFYLPLFNIYLDPKNPHVQTLQSEKIVYLKRNYSNIIIGTFDEIITHLKDLVCSTRLERACLH